MRLSVVVDNFNYARYLREALDSVLPQLAPDDELIVVDDGSTDASPEILAAYARLPQVTVLQQANQGQLAALCNGLEAARGDLCLLLDSDDYFLPGYLQRLRALAGAWPDIELFFCAAQVGGESSASVRGIRRMLADMALPEGPTGTSRWSTVSGGEYVGAPTSGLALRRSLARRLLAVRENLPDQMPVSTRIARWLGIPRHSHTAARLSGDGIIVRASSVAGCRKYHSATPGFFYRIHRSNAFASIGRPGRLYLRWQRSRQIVRLARTALGLQRRPELAEVVAEMGQRSRPLRLRRRLTMVRNYGRAIVMARGSLLGKAGALLRALRCAL
ncbi:glycosyltransferase [Haliea sp. E1-2-M8]|uniref:glycosyltransferase family 2 protein n=1 Tax=Haliea sp. E1-2-M8 TaxID=3064706 RepID=UPI00271FC381|nr:glycosyltransferase [Haliea sp. E1-2-M8]MDO8862440.1 glycosyltransferase [Haliea sp. E1-2-M8]